MADIHLSLHISSVVWADGYQISFKSILSDAKSNMSLATTVIRAFSHDGKKTCVNHGYVNASLGLYTNINLISVSYVFMTKTTPRLKRAVTIHVYQHTVHASKIKL